MNLLARCLLALILLPSLVASAGADSIRQLPLPTKDLIYDPFSKQLYASVPSRAGSIGNSVVASAGKHHAEGDVPDHHGPNDTPEHRNDHGLLWRRDPPRPG